MQVARCKKDFYRGEKLALLKGNYYLIDSKNNTGVTIIDNLGIKQGFSLNSDFVDLVDYDLNEHYEALKTIYKVENILQPDSKIIFILESPHVDELYYDAPVSGLSGGTMTRALFDEDNKTPLGRGIKNNQINDTRTSQIGIMNICQIPMQLKAYVGKDTITKYGTFDENEHGILLSLLESIRTNPKEQYKEQAKKQLQDIILDDFRTALSLLPNKKHVLIPCGKTAQKFFEMANVKNVNWTIIKDVPHPSYNSWARKSHKQKIQEIIECFN